jgi:hypothetical protein
MSRNNLPVDAERNRLIDFFKRKGENPPPPFQSMAESVHYVF